VFSDYLNLFLFDAKNEIGAVVRALQGKGVFQSLAEPNLVALNGKEASFLAGGEFPYPVPQGQFGTFTIMFKEYGVRLNFTPTVLGGDLINLKIRPEVSSLDFNNAIIIEGFRIPALVARRAETEVELQDGQTFAIAGLLNNTALQQMRKVPGLGDIPVLGQLFRSRAYSKEQTELVVMITPQIVRRGGTGASQALPNLAEPFLGPNPKPIAPPAPYVGSPHEGPVGGKKPTASAQPPAAPGSNGPANAAPQTPAPTAVKEPMRSQPIQGEAALPAAPALDRKALEAEKKRLEKEAEEQRKANEEDEKQRRVQAKKDEDARKQAEKLDKERAKKQAEADRKAAEIARRKAEEDQKREKALAEAAARLKQAQAAYQAEVSKNKGGQQ
jgi:hypothetical protein